MDKCNSVAVGNVQPHSCGEIFPWSIVVVEYGLSGNGYMYALNGETGRRMSEWLYDRTPGSWQTAYNRAWVQAHGALVMKAVAKRSAARVS